MEVWRRKEAMRIGTIVDKNKRKKEEKKRVKKPSHKN
jgi:hypothetical protein